MKIAVITNLSPAAAGVTHYAMHLAKKMKANVLLFNLQPVPALPLLQAAGGTGAYMEDEPDNALANYALEMERLLAAKSFAGSWLPAITFNNDSTGLVDIMTAIAEDSDIKLLVTGVPEETELAVFMRGEPCSRLIDWARIPVMVVPENTSVKNPEKIAFATTLHQEDIRSIAELGGLMGAFAAELMVAHLNPDPTDAAARQAEQELNRLLYQLPGCGGVYLRSVADTKPQKDWEWLKANKRTDILALMQGSREQMSAFFKRGQGHQLTWHLNIPVIVMPKRP